MKTDTQVSLLKYFIIFVVVVAIAMILKPFTIVQETDRAVVLRMGAYDRTLDQGFHFITPLVDSVITMPVNTQKIETNASAASNDLQSVSTDIAVQFNLRPGSVADVYSDMRTDYVNILIDPAIQDAVKAATARYNAEALITKRPEVKETITQILRERFESNGINLSNVDISDFQFSEEFDQAVEQKITAEQQALRAERDLERVEFEAQQRIEQSRGEAEAIRIQAEAITQQGGKDYVQLQAIDKWDGKLPTRFIPGQTVPFLNLTN